MSGHSKWNNIKHKKAASDSRKGKVFTEIAKMIRVAVIDGKSGDPGSNPTLRLAVEKAREANMPKENVQRAIDRGLGVGKTGRIEEVLYEGYGPGGVGMLVNAHTDNRQRTGSEIRFTFDKYGGNLGSPGSVAYLFERVGRDFVVKIPLSVDENIKEQVNVLIERLEELDDVEEVIVNLLDSSEHE